MHFILSVTLAMIFNTFTILSHYKSQAGELDLRQNLCIFICMLNPINAP